MIDFFSANLERKRVKIRVKGTVAETYGAFGPHRRRLIKQIGIEIWAVHYENKLTKNIRLADTVNP